MTVAAFVLALLGVVVDAVLAWFMFRHRQVGLTLTVEPEDPKEG